MQIVGINADMSDDTAEPRSEIECAEMISRGQLPSPSFWYGSELFAIRFTGLGAAYRSRNDEVAWREPSLWKSDAMLRRCVAVPVIVGHPETGILNSKEFAARMIGITIFSYVRDDAIWTIMRVLDHEAAEALVDEQAYKFLAERSVCIANRQHDDRAEGRNEAPGRGDPGADRPSRDLRSRRLGHRKGR